MCIRQRETGKVRGRKGRKRIEKGEQGKRRDGEKRRQERWKEKGWGRGLTILQNKPTSHFNMLNAQSPSIISSVTVLPFDQGFLNQARWKI